MRCAPQNNTQHYLVLDGMRGVAALAVLAFHSCEYFMLGYSPAHAYLAVDFFFLLSGFVIAHAYDSRLARGMGVWGFLRVRLLRLYPLVALGLVLGMAVYLAVALAQPGLGIKVSAILKAVLANAMLFPSSALLSVRPWAFPVDTPLWSLSIELWVNLLYAGAFIWLTRYRLMAVCVLGAGLVAYVALGHGGLNVGYSWRDFYLGGGRVLFPFAVGVLMRRMLGSGGPLHGWGHGAVVPLLLVLGAPAFGGAWYDVMVVVLVFPLLVGVGAAAAPRARLDPIWRWLGELSYPLYVLHYPFVVAVANLMKMRHLQAWAPELALATMGGVIVVAWGASRLYDIPLRRWLGRRMRSASMQAGAGARPLSRQQPPSQRH